MSAYLHGRNEILHLSHDVIDLTHVAVSNSDHIAPSGRMVVNSTLERLWKETVMAYF
jgi:hypothetical protein